VPFLTPNNDTERERVGSDLVEETKVSEVGKKGWVFVIEPSSRFVNQNDNSKLDEGDDSNDTNNRSTHWLFSTTDKVDRETETFLQQSVVNEVERETIEE
jgi:hypothetical protein